MVVRMRANRAHRDNRRAHHALIASRLSICSNCHKAHLSHTVCLNCGMYRGIKVLDAGKKLAKKEKKLKAEKKAS